MKGQSLIELLIAVGIFTIIIGVVSFSLLDSYTLNLKSQQNSIAVFLAEEGLEATRSIRDNNWNNLGVGEHGLVISDSVWNFQGLQEDISNKLKGGIRKIIVERIDAKRKKVTSKIIWETAQGNYQEISLVTYLNNWQKRQD